MYARKTGDAPKLARAPRGQRRQPPVGDAPFAGRCRAAERRWRRRLDAVWSRWLIGDKKNPSAGQMDFSRKTRWESAIAFWLGTWARGGFAASSLGGDSLFSLWFSIEQEPWKIAPSETMNESVYTSPVKRDCVSNRTLSARTVPLTMPSMYASLHCKWASASPDWLIVSSPSAG